MYFAVSSAASPWEMYLVGHFITYSNPWPIASLNAQSRFCHGDVVLAEPTFAISQTRLGLNAWLEYPMIIVWKGCISCLIPVVPPFVQEHGREIFIAMETRIHFITSHNTLCC